MNQSLLVPALAGVAAGLVVALLFIALYTRSQRRSASGIVASARADAERMRKDSARQAEAARSEALVAAKMETLKLREDVDREAQRRREEFERLELRADE